MTFNLQKLAIKICIIGVKFNLNTIEVNKAADIESICGRFLKGGANVSTIPVTEICNLCINLSWELLKSLHKKVLKQILHFSQSTFYP